MLRVNLRDGRTLSYDLLDAASSARWQAHQSDPAFQPTVTGLAVLWEGELHTLPLPRLYKTVRWTAELIEVDGAAIGVQAAVQADDTRALVTVYFSGPVATRTDLQKVGKPRFMPG